MIVVRMQLDFKIIVEKAYSNEYHVSQDAV